MKVVKSEIKSYIPHREPFIMIDNLLDIQGDTYYSDFTIEKDNLFLHNGFFTQLDLTAQENMIRVNVLALTSMCHLFANDMAQRKAGSILNIASLAAWMPIPNQNVYAATKAYVLAFSQALHDEMRAADTGVTITALCPGYTATKMMNNPDQGGRLMISEGLLQSAEQVAEIGLNACLAGKSTVVPGLANRITAAFTHLFPKTFFAKWMGRFYRNNMR